MTPSDKLHVDHWDNFFDDELHARLYPTWWDPTTANHWRHRRFLEPVLDVLQTREDTWLTIGDGSGHDSWMLLQNGFKDVLSTDIGIGTLKKSHAEGRIQKYAVANAEELRFADQQFDFVLCKEAFHHMARPYLGIYEMLRVCRKGLVIIEPQDQWIDFPTRAGTPTPNYERVGNYVYSLSQRELQKICLGLNFPGLLWKNMYDVYIQGCEFARADESDPIFSLMTQSVADAEKRCAAHQEKWNYILAIIVKEQKTLEILKQKAAQRRNGWVFESTNTNPHLNNYCQS